MSVKFSKVLKPAESDYLYLEFIMEIIFWGVILVFQMWHEAWSKEHKYWLNASIYQGMLNILQKNIKE